MKKPSKKSQGTRQAAPHKLSLSRHSPPLPRLRRVVEIIGPFLATPIAWAVALAAGIASLLAVYDIYCDNSPEIHPNRESVGALSVLPFTINNRSKFFRMDNVGIQCVVDWLSQNVGPDGVYASVSGLTVASTEKNRQIDPRSSPTFNCELSKVVRGQQMSDNHGNIWHLEPARITVTIKVDYTTRLFVFDWRRAQYVSQPFTLTYTGDGYYWSEGSTIN